MLEIDLPRMESLSPQLNSPTINDDDMRTLSYKALSPIPQDIGDETTVTTDLCGCRYKNKSTCGCKYINKVSQAQFPKKKTKTNRIQLNLFENLMDTLNAHTK